VIGRRAAAVALRELALALTVPAIWGRAAPTSLLALLPPSPFEVREVSVDGDPTGAGRLLVCVPAGASDAPLPLVVLLHGLGETTDVRLGLRAWLDRYGLQTAYDRLAEPPVARTSSRADWTEARVVAVNDELARRPFGGLVLACPFTPDVWRASSTARALEAYAAFLADRVVPRVREEASVRPGAEHVGLMGCSLGGFVGFEVMLRRMESFAAFAGVQSAIGAAAAAASAARWRAAEERLPAARDTTRRPALLLETSLADPYLAANRALSGALGAAGVPHDLLVLPGPHDQPWLREGGTLEALLWQERRLTR
jgi:enterochelin esterase-like enzyme